MLPWSGRLRVMVKIGPSSSHRMVSNCSGEVIGNPSTGWRVRDSVLVSANHGRHVKVPALWYGIGVQLTGQRGQRKGAPGSVEQFDRQVEVFHDTGHGE